EQKTNFRPTVPTVKAFRARVDLYRGNYESALTNANAALQAHNKLVTIKDDPNYELSGIMQEVHFLDETKTKITKTFECKYAPMLQSLGTQAFAEYEELYLASATQPGYSWSTYALPMSESHYNLFDKENDARWLYFYNTMYPLLGMYTIQEVAEIDGKMTPGCISAENQKWLKPWMMHSYTRFYGNGYIDILGMTTAEMMLIKAECLARDGKTSEAAQVLKDLRKTRFMNQESANNIGGSIQEVLDERQREMTYLWRFFDIKRLNGAENAGIALKRKVLSNQMDLNSVTEMVIEADDPRWALPFYKNEAQDMGWAQNEGWE
ncbi:MAG: RagB/SusD family nutrient uptake outer membrane protein, partial [Bacteroidales bacterium]|nr:RagB/SusD family nutrient uptake outer membrane protein [Bacteroidales bacterium]